MRRPVAFRRRIRQQQTLLVAPRVVVVPRHVAGAPARTRDLEQLGADGRGPVPRSGAEAPRPASTSRSRAGRSAPPSSRRCSRYSPTATHVSPERQDTPADDCVEAGRRRRAAGPPAPPARRSRRSRPGCGRSRSRPGSSRLRCRRRRTCRTCPPVGAYWLEPSWRSAVRGSPSRSTSHPRAGEAGPGFCRRRRCNRHPPRRHPECRKRRRSRCSDSHRSRRSTVPGRPAPSTYR